MIHPKDFVASLMNDLRKVNEIKSEVTADEQHRTSLSPLSSDALSSAHSVTNLQASMKYDCKECGKVYGKKCSLTRHMMSHKPGMVRCSACNWYFEDTEKLALHNEKFHSASYVCDECGSSMSRKSSLRKHMLRVHPDKCLARFTCTYSPCKAVFDSESLYNDHLNIHEGRKPHKCCQCEKAFASIISLKSHVLNHSKDLKSSQCDVCGKVFQGNGALHNHRMSVHEQKRYKCELCQKEFMYRSGYCKHLLSHKKEKSKKKLGISNSGVKLRDLKILAGLGEKGVKLLTTGVVGKGGNLSVGLHSDTKTVNKDNENIVNCVDSDTNSKEPSGLLQKSQNLNINETVVSFETASGTNPVADKTSTEVDCASTNLQGVRQAEGVSPDGLIITTSDMDPNSQVTNIGEPVLSGTTSLQGVQLAHSGQIVWIYQN